MNGILMDDVIIVLTDLNSFNYVRFGKSSNFTT